MTKEEAKKVFEYLEKKANTQEPCTDAVSIRKDMLKCRVGNIVAYNVDWLKDHWQMEMDIVCGVKPCDDAISREDAVHALRKALWDYEDKTEKQFRERDDLDYEEWYFHRIFVQAMNDEDVETICKLPSVTQKSGHWISVSERLPEDAQEILYSTKTGCVFHGEYYDDNTDRKWFSYKDDTFSFNNVVNAWMPLPKPYEPQESEEQTE